MSLGLSPFRAQAKLDDLPATPEAIKYLMALVNGSNPEIPPYMALGRLEQMKHEMEKEAPQPPQGTVKDKTMQAAGIMALQGGQQQQAAQQMAQAAPQNMPVPQNVPQPQMQPEEETQMAAGGGLMRARVDPRMFSFAPGGIVSFAGEDQSYVDLDRIRAEAEEASNKLRTYGLRQRKEDPQGYDEAVKRAEEAKAAIRAKEREITGGPAGAMRQPMGAGSAFVIPQTPDRPPTSTAEVNAVSSIGDLPVGGSAPPPPPPADGQRPPAGPRPAGNVGIAQAIPPETQIMLDRLKKSDTDSQGIIGKLGEQAERFKKDFYDPMKAEAGKSELQLARERADIDKQLGIGQYGEELEKARQERAKRYEDTKKGRSDKIIDSMLDAFVTPGARAGDMSKARSALKQKFEDADEDFSTAQQNMMLDVKKYREQLAIGNRDKAFEAKTAANANFVKMATELAKLENVPLEQALSFMQSSNKQYQDVYKLILDFRTHKEKMAQDYSLRRDALRERALQNKRAYDQRNDQLNFQYAKANVAAHNPELKSLAARESMLVVQRDVALKNKDFEKADSLQEQLDALQTQRANIMLPIAGRAEAMQGSGITGAPGAAAASKGAAPKGKFLGYE
jgi:hypothetical protein